MYSFAGNMKLAFLTLVVLFFFSVPAIVAFEDVFDSKEDLLNVTGKCVAYLTSLRKFTSQNSFMVFAPICFSPLRSNSACFLQISCSEEV